MVCFFWNLKELVWFMENWDYLKFLRSVLGRRDVGEFLKLSVLFKDNDYDYLLLEIIKILKIGKKEEFFLKLNGVIMDLSFNEDKVIFIIEN